jgi:phosphohistidine phosphatase
MLLHEITTVKNNKDLMVIGHNDGISDLASYLTGEHIYFKTGMLWILEFNGNSWEELSAETALATSYYRSDCR